MISASGQKGKTVIWIEDNRVRGAYGPACDSFSVVAEEWCFIANTSIPEHTLNPRPLPGRRALHGPAVIYWRCAFLILQRDVVMLY